jgi:hypothetical protein
MESAMHNLFLLLELLLPPDDVRAAVRSLLSDHSALHARALEYLDNTLSGTVRRDVFAVIGDTNPEEKVRSGGRPQRVERPGDTVRRLITTDPAQDRDHRGLAVAALYWVWEEGFDDALPAVEEAAATSTDPLVRETAQWVLARVRGEDGRAAKRATMTSGESGAATAETKGGVMAPMASIEMMVVLQNVDLFSYCDAEQVLRLAAIAREVTFTEGEVIYRRIDPADALFCVVEGRVELIDGEGNREEVGPGGRFGVLEILAGRLRSSNATAIEPVRALVIEADDFFDLLSNNIEIVKALFRQITLPAGATTRSLL